MDMTIEQRREAFIQEQNALVQKYGIVISGTILWVMPEGQAPKATVQLSAIELEGWQPSDAGGDNGGSDDT